MKIFLSDQSREFSTMLERLKKTPVLAYDKASLPEKVSSVPLDIDFSNADFSAFFNYGIFPPKIMKFRTQWQEEGRTMRVGDTILLQIFIPPFPPASLKVVFGVRISDITDSADRKAFSYETLEGHVEKGISTFSIERAADKWLFTIHTFSEPGNPLTRLLAPVFSIPYQAYCTRAALRNVKDEFEAQSHTK